MNTTPSPALAASRALPLPRVDARFVRDLLLQVLAEVEAPFALLEEVHEARSRVRPAVVEAMCRMRFLRRYETFEVVLADAVHAITGDAGLAERARAAYRRMLEGGRSDGL